MEPVVFAVVRDHFPNPKAVNWAQGQNMSLELLVLNSYIKELDVGLRGLYARFRSGFWVQNLGSQVKRIRV